MEGVAVMTSEMDQRQLQKLERQKMPVVLLGVHSKAFHVSNIGINYRTGFRQAVQHLVALRHERIAFVSGPLTLIPAIERREAFLRSMEELRVTVDRDLVVACDHSPIEGERALERIMRLTEKPSAVVCSNDMTAIVMSKSFALGIKNSRRFVRNWFG